MDEILLAVVAGMVGNLLDGHTGCGEHMLGPVNAAQYNIFIGRIAGMCLKFPGKMCLTPVDRFGNLLHGNGLT